MEQHVAQIFATFCDWQNRERMHLDLFKSQFFIPKSTLDAINESLTKIGAQSQIDSEYWVHDKALERMEQEEHDRYTIQDVDTWLDQLQSAINEVSSLCLYPDPDPDAVKLREQMYGVKKRASVLSPKSSANCFVRAFILVASAFDAAITDLIPFAVRSHPADATQLLGQVSIKTSDAINFATLDEFNDRILEAFQFAPLKAKLKFFAQSGFDPNQLTKLRECIHRRNSIAHRNSQADQQYINDSGNPYGLAAGDELVTDDKYFNTAADLFYDFLWIAAEWI